MSNLKHQVLKDIKEQGIKPTSRFYFVTRNYFFWLLFAVSVIVGAFAFSSILFALLLNQEYWNTLPFFSKSSLFIQSVPFFWLVLLVLFTISAWFNFKRTDGAHRRQNAMVVLASILFSMLLGVLLFRFGVAEHVQNIFTKHSATYRTVTELKLEKQAAFMKDHDLDSARAILLRREKLRTLCLNQGRTDCFAELDALSDAEVTEELEDAGIEVTEEVKENTE